MRKPPDDVTWDDLRVRFQKEKWRRVGKPLAIAMAILLAAILCGRQALEKATPMQAVEIPSLELPKKTAPEPRPLSLCERLSKWSGQIAFSLDARSERECN